MLNPISLRRPAVWAGVVACCSFWSVVFAQDAASGAPTLSVAAWQDRSGSTEVKVTVQPQDGAGLIALASVRLKLTAIDPTGQRLWSESYATFRASPGPEPVTFVEQFTGLQLGTLIVAEAHVKALLTKTQRLQASAHVQLQPEPANVTMLARYEATIDRDRLVEWDIADESRGRQVLLGSQETYEVRMEGFPTVTTGQVDRVEVAFGGDDALSAEWMFEAVDLSVYGEYIQLDRRTWLQIRPGDGAYSPGDPVDGLVVEVSHQPSDYLWTSEIHDYTTGETVTDSGSPNDDLWLPTRLADFRLIVTVQGQTYTGRISVPLESEPVDYEQTDSWPGYEYYETDTYLSRWGEAEKPVAP